ncbi:hypothetical protein [Deinococcus aestuarii]|uniref:hypothetical protein n=1 Tax=Deinococcus aestuarii TaxID=2774531 RepID=UPI001C0AFC95|nr:hypothetical protein [Deinococcus aestuarii]
MTDDNTDGLFPELIQTLEGSDFIRDPQAHEDAGEASVPDDESVSTSTEDLPDGNFILLSTLLLRDLPPAERSLVVEHYEDGVRRSIIRSVQLEGTSFTVRMLAGGQTGRRRSLQDELIRRTPEFEEWLRVQRTESLYAYRAATGRATSTLERLRTGQDDFNRLADLRRQLLRGKGRGTE